MLSGGHQHDKNAFFVNTPKNLLHFERIFAFPHIRGIWELDEAQKSVMYDGKFSHQEEILTHRKCFLIYDEFAPELMPHIKCEKKYPTLYFYNI